VHIYPYNSGTLNLVYKGKHDMKRLIFAFILLVLPFSLVLAQPPSINTALDDLNARLGTALTLTDLDDWSWSENIYDDASLDCPQEGQSYAQVVTKGYAFSFEVGDVVYNYRGYEDGTVFLCGTTAAPLATAVPIPTQTLAAPSGALITPANAEGVRQIDNTDNTLVPTLAWSPDGSSLVVGAAITDERLITGGVLVYDAADLSNAPLLVELPAPVTELAYGQRGNVAFLATGHSNGAVVLTDAPLEGSESVLLDDPSGALDAVMALAISPDGQYVAAASGVISAPDAPSFGTVRVWDSESGDQIAVYDLTAPAFALAFSPDSATLAIGDANGSLTLAVLDDAPIVNGYNLFLSPITALDYSPDSSTIAAGGTDGLTRLWTIATAETGAVLDNATQDAIYTLDYSPDGTVLAAGGGNVEAFTRDNAIRLWNATGFNVLGGLLGHETPVRAALFSPDGTRIATVSEDGSLRLWGVGVE
jgi:WD40 repeat protein